ncbi:MAG TPA: hypothetical protein VF105_05145 [Gemmatimonadaceae bacterium]
MAKKKGILKPGATPIVESPSGFKVYGREAVDPDKLLAMERQAEGPEFKAKVARDNAHPAIRYAVAEDALPQKADAAVLRDATGADDRIIVVSRGTASDRILSISRFALFLDEGDDPDFRGQKTILVWDDGRIAVGTTVKRISAHFSESAGEAHELLNQPGETTHLRGIGKVRSVRGQ